MTADEIIQAAQAEVSDFIGSVTVSSSVSYTRISQRQRQLFQRAGQIEEDYYGICATGTLDGSLDALDLSDIADPVEAIERVTRIEIADAGTSELTAGERVNPVKIDDAASGGLPPRCTVRNKIVTGVNDDLDGVVSLMVFYSRRPLAVSSGDTAAELQPPFDHLLVYDLGKFFVRRVLRSDAAKRTEVIAFLEGLENELLAEFDAHVARFAPVQRRFG